jgi:hypothetical protein
MSGNALLDLLIIALPAALAGLWWTGSKARELAIGHAKLACRHRQLQFLDQTVALTRMKPARSATGSSCLLREYGFEFTDQGQFRDTGTITMRGHVLQRVHFPYTRDEEGNRIYVH